MAALDALIDSEYADVDVMELGMPESVRTPGRTWTKMEFDETAVGNGTITVECEDSHVEILPLKDAAKELPELHKVVFSGISPDDNRIAATHAQLVEDGIVVKVPSGAVIEEPITITTTGQNGFYPHHVVVYVDDGATVEVTERNDGSAGLDSSFTDIYVGKDANVSYTKINNLDQGTGYSENYAHVSGNSAFNFLQLSTGADLYKNRLKTNLAGRHAEFAYDLGFLAANEQHMDITTHVIHNADNTRCDMDSRGVALDQSRTVYKGVQEVKQNAERTQSFQNEKTIMVGEDCEADTTPQLQIDNNDVEATHAATTGHIDEVDLFYMKSRGLNETDAKREIITGMFDDLIEGGNEAGKDVMHAKIQETLR